MSDRVFLQQLYPNPDAVVKEAPNIDIVLIHGVNGGAIKTWECTKDQNKNLLDPVVWPRDLLPQQFPRARILAFGYNGDIYRNDSLAGIRDLGKTLLSYLTLKRQDVEPSRPILFIAHCLGGIIVKQALHTAHYERDYSRIAKETAGIFFFGTPHLSSSKDKWDHLVKAYSSLDKPSGWLRRSRLVKALQKDSDELVDLMNKFRHMMVKDNRGVDRSGKTSMRWTIVNFYETVEYPGAKACIVDMTAAQMNVPGEILKAVHRDHAGMCQFATEEDPAFQELCAEIKKLVPEEYRQVGVFEWRVKNDGEEDELRAEERAGSRMIEERAGNHIIGDQRQGYYLEERKPELSDILGPRVVEVAETVQT
ncbi:hypothetical protein B0T21DRAFT_454319 [Apiosordaria backusii]|uniref:DUF676 domain-containing protein n=1 Tax=Apiosordaria backusii TaxID=314023 RepID=A0AA40DYS2_9PEZI|nr:hypothetical protein B0T21DRAFT_454319 [Apiosordaria backusii]